jgi:L-alanine-DL-glutamate epimerase-like enolase superfamily enzyme
MRDHEICEYPVEPKALALDATLDHLERDANGQITLPERPGLGIRPDLEGCRRYLIQTEIRVGGKTIYETPELRD